MYLIAATGEIDSSAMSPSEYMYWYSSSSYGVRYLPNWELAMFVGSYYKALREDTFIFNGAPARMYQEYSTPEGTGYHCLTGVDLDELWVKLSQNNDLSFYPNKHEYQSYQAWRVYHRYRPMRTKSHRTIKYRSIHAHSRLKVYEKLIEAHKSIAGTNTPHIRHAGRDAAMRIKYQGAWDDYVAGPDSAGWKHSTKHRHQWEK